MSKTMKKPYTEDQELELAMAIDVTPAAMQLVMQRMEDLTDRPERDPGLSQFVDEVVEGINTSMIKQALGLTDDRAEEDLVLESAIGIEPEAMYHMMKRMEQMMAEPERDQNLKQFVDEAESAITADVIAKLLDLPDSWNEMASAFEEEGAADVFVSEYRDPYFAKAMEEFDNLPMDGWEDLKGFLSANEQYSLSDELERVEKGVIRLAKYYIKKLAS